MIENYLNSILIKGEKMKQIIAVFLALLCVILLYEYTEDDYMYISSTEEQKKHYIKEENEEDPYDVALKIIEDYKAEVTEKYPALPKEDNVVDIILFAGQSNSSGRATADEVPGVGERFVSVDKSKAFTFYNDRFTEPKAIEEPILGNGTEDQYFGYIPTFLNSYYDNTGRMACACFKSVGGMMMNSFLPYTVDENGNETDLPQRFYTEMVEYINFAKENLTLNGYTPGHVYMVWCQGEAEAAYYGFENVYANYTEERLVTYEEKTDYYKKTFTRIFDSLKEDAGVEKAFIVRIGHSNNKKDALRNRCIIDAQTQMCKENDDFIMVSGYFAGAKCCKTEEGVYKNMMRDASHYYLDVYLTVGEEAAFNAAVYINSGYTEEPKLFEYHKIYLDSCGALDETVYEEEHDKYIYDPAVNLISNEE